MSQIPAIFDTLRANLADPGRGLAALGQRASALEPGDGRRHAAILVLISDEPDVVFTERAAHLRKHAGQVAFPGGAVDEADADPAAAALREGWEEVGLQPASVDVLGCLPPAFVPVSGFDVTTVVGRWRDPHPLVLAEAEVASIHRVPVARLADPVDRVTARHPSGYTGPAFIVDDLFIWGFSAHILNAVLHLGGWAQPWDTDRIVDVPGRFMHDRRLAP